MAVTMHKLEIFEKQLRAEGFSVERAAFDVADIAAVRAFFGRQKRLDILVNNAVSMQVKSFSALQPSDFAATYESAVTAAFEAVARRLAGPETCRGDRGRGQHRQCRVHVQPGRARRAPLCGARKPEPFSLWPRQGGAAATDPSPRRRAGAGQDPRQCAGAGTFPGQSPTPSSRAGWPGAPCWGGWVRPARSPDRFCSWHRRLPAT